MIARDETPVFDSSFSSIRIGRRHSAVDNVGRRRYSRHADALLGFFSEHGVATARQVQARFGAQVGGDRATRMHLQTLVRAGDLRLMTSEFVGQPNVYRVTARGLRHISVDGNRIAERKPSRSHLSHELAITDFASRLHATARRRGDIALRWEARASLSRYRDVFNRLVPDYAFLFETGLGRLICLVEVSCGEESATRLGQKLRKYQAWAVAPESERFLVSQYERAGARQPRAGFRLLVVCQNRRTGNDDTRLQQVLRECSSLEAAMASRVWLTTHTCICQVGDSDASIWFAVREVVKSEPGWDRLDAARRRGLLAASWKKFPTQPLFPAAKGE